MELQGYLRIFRDRWIAIVVGILVGIGVAAIIGTSIPRSYSATATLFLSVQSDTGSLNERSQFGLAHITSYPELAYGSDVLSETINSLGLNLSAQQLGNSITVTNPPTTLLLQIKATSGDPVLAGEIANSVATNLASVVSNLENSPADSHYSVNLKLGIPAGTPSTASGPQLSIVLGLGLLGGLALGLIVAIVWGRLDTTIRSVTQVRRISGLPVLGQLPRLSSHDGRSDGTQLTTREARFREAQLNIALANGTVLPDVLLLVPASRAADEVQVRVSFARAFAATGRSVCLVEGDFRGGIDSILGTADAARGLADVLDGSRSITDVVIPVEGEHFSLVPAGNPENQPKELEAERHIGRAMRELASSFDITVMQATSITHPASLELAGPYADGVVVLVRFGRTHSADLGHVLSHLRLTGVRPLGIVMTDVPSSRRSDLAAHWLPGDFNEVKRTPVRTALDSPADAAATEITSAPKPLTTGRAPRRQTAAPGRVRGTTKAAASATEDAGIAADAEPRSVSEPARMAESVPDAGIGQNSSAD
jgi:capsular polysaccharide biosynthesis protein